MGRVAQRWNDNPSVTLIDAKPPQMALADALVEYYGTGDPAELLWPRWSRRSRLWNRWLGQNYRILRDPRRISVSPIDSMNFPFADSATERPPRAAIHM